MSKPDRVADLMDSAEASTEGESELLGRRNRDRSGLVLLYPIDKDSKPKASAKNYRSPLGAVDHLMGVAFSFPSAAPESRSTNFIQVEMPNIIEVAAVEGDEQYVDEEGERNEVDLGSA